MQVIVGAYFLVIAYALFKSAKIMKTRNEVPAFMRPGKVVVRWLIRMMRGERAAREYEEATNVIYVARIRYYLRIAQVLSILAAAAGAISIAQFMFQVLVGG